MTGSSSGMGRAMALALAEAGAAVVCSDVRKTARGEGHEPDIDVDTDELIAGAAARRVYVQTDVSDAGTWRG